MAEQANPMSGGHAATTGAGGVAGGIAASMYSTVTGDS
jgi:hypothetical protein